jgi:hypothetical protein
MHQTNSYTVTENESVKISCKALYGLENDQKLKWTWYHLNNKIDTPSKNFAIHNSKSTQESTLTINSVPLEARGNIVCEAQNEYGSHSRETLLRVRGNNQILFLKFDSLLTCLF